MKFRPHLIWLPLTLFALNAAPVSHEQKVETEVFDYLSHLFNQKNSSPSQKEVYKKLKSIDQVGHGYAKAQISRDLQKFLEMEIDEDEASQVKNFVSQIKTLTDRLKTLLEQGDELEDWEDFYEELDEIWETYEEEGEDFSDIDTIKDLIENAELDSDSPYRLALSQALELPADEVHQQLKTEQSYVSATKCQSCHPGHFEQWSISQHAYSQISPVYMAMQNAINHLTSGTNGDFCIRCHNQVGMNKSEPTFMKNAHRHPASREGITCIVCHRISPGDNLSKEKALEKGSLPYGKVSGRMDLHEGDLNALIFGPDGGHGSSTNKEISSVKQTIHEGSGKFKQISTSGFCGTCHDVNLFNGFRLEEAFSEYKNSPAAKNNISCQDCHMGLNQGEVVLGEDGKLDPTKNYLYGKVATSSSRERKVTNHMFSGPDHSVVHPGIFPTSDELVKMATLEEWLEFDFEKGWGSESWENAHRVDGRDHLIPPDSNGKPSRWMYREHREQAREKILEQFHRLALARRERVRVLRNGFRLVPTTSGDQMIHVSQSDLKGLEFEIGVHNPTDGHNTPTGFIAERLIWLDVEVTKKGEPNPIFRSGDLDPNGDLRDSHSLFVHSGGSRMAIADGHGAQRLMYNPSTSIPNDYPTKVELDKQLFSLQSKFITRNLRGGEREQVLAINHSLDTLPFIRPSTTSTVLTGQPAGARIHRLSLPPLGTKTASYKVHGNDLKGPGTYQIKIQLKVGMVPVNLIDAIKAVGFDYNMSTKELARRIVYGFEKERNALKRFSIPDKRLYLTIVNDPERRDLVKKIHPEIQTVLSDKEREEFVNDMALNLFAQEVQQERLSFILEQLKKTSLYKSWEQPESEFQSVLAWVRGNNVDRLMDLETYLKKQQPHISEKDASHFEKALEACAPPLRSAQFNFQHRSQYWKRDPRLKTNLSGLASNGLILEKVAGHEVLEEAHLEVIID